MLGAMKPRPARLLALTGMPFGTFVETADGKFNAGKIGSKVPR